MYKINHQCGIIGDRLHVKLWTKTRKLGPDNKYYITNHVKEGSFDIGDYDFIIDFVDHFNSGVQRWQLCSIINPEHIEKEKEYVTPRASDFVLDTDQTPQHELDLRIIGI